MTMPQLEGASNLAMDVNALSQLKMAAHQKDPSAVRKSAQQFEALFIHMMLKSMRQASASQDDSWTGGADGQMYTAMLDQQLSQVMAQRGMGLADMLLRQLSPLQDGYQKGSNSADPVDIAKPAKSSGSLGAERVDLATKSTRSMVEAFRQSVGKAANKASEMTGLPAAFILGQAALESGWGSREILGPQGERSFNVFGIKAGGQWQGATVDVLTTEFVDGVPRKVTGKFRAYESYEQAFEDYARLLTRHPRYASVLQSGQNLQAFAQSMQESGYATDPMYAQKLIRLISQNFLS